jgi:hypothetical protein
MQLTSYLIGPWWHDELLTMSSIQNQKEHEQQRQQQPWQIRQQKQTQQLQQYSILGTFIGIVSCSILRILDHGMQIQRYPIPLLVGATWGGCGGVALGVLKYAFSVNTIFIEHY